MGWAEEWVGQRNDLPENDFKNQALAIQSWAPVYGGVTPRRQLIVGRPASNPVTLWAAPAARVIPRLNPPVLLAGGFVRISYTGVPGTSCTVVTTKDPDKP